MRAGTKTLLFGNHHLILHPVLVTIAWVRIYKQFPSFKELVCIIVHDWGYWGKRDVDGPDGEQHPAFGARLTCRLFGDKCWQTCAGHSRFYAHQMRIPVSRLCLADKYSPFVAPAWIWVFLGTLSGEIREYTSHSKYEQHKEHGGCGGFEWYWAYREQCLKWVKAGRVESPK